jgi:hypothetical protein
LVCALLWQYWPAGMVARFDEPETQPLA